MYQDKFAVEKKLYNKINKLTSKIGFNLDNHVGDYIARLILALGFDLRKCNDDRYTLEEMIFPYFIERPEYHRVLFVGCAWYTNVYEKLFHNKEYWTIEIDPGQGIFGAKNHIVDSIENISNHFQPGSLDLIICNGVFGWGVSTKEASEKTFTGCFDCLRQDGVLVHGWDDIPRAKPFPPSECRGIQKFREFVFPPLATSEYMLHNYLRHTFNFYIK